MQKQLQTWEPSEHLLEGSEIPRKILWSLMQSDSSFLSNTPCFAKYAAFWKAGRLRSFVLLTGAPCTWIWISSIDGITLKGKNWSNRKKSWPNAAVFTRGLIWTHLGSKRDLRVERPANNHCLKKRIQLKFISRHSSYRAVITIGVGQRTNKLQLILCAQGNNVCYCILWKTKGTYR